MKKTRWVLLVAVVLFCIIGVVLSIPESRCLVLAYLKSEAWYHGRPTGYWSLALRKHYSFVGEPRPQWQVRLERWVSFSGPAGPDRHLTDPDPLGELDASAVPVLIELLKDRQSSQVRCVAAYHLGLLGQTAQVVVPALSEAVQDPDELVQVEAIAALERIGPPGQVGPARLVALHDKRARVRITAADALRRLDPQAAKEAGIN